MQLVQHKVSDTGRRVQTFLDSQRAVLGTVVPTTIRAQLDAAVTQLDAAQVDQQTLTGSTRGEKATQDAIRKEINTDYLRPIAKGARHALRGSPDFLTLVVSGPELRKGDFLGKIKALADAAAKHEQELIGTGLPVDFIAKLKAAIAQLDASVATRGVQLGQLQQAGKAIADATKVVRSVIGVMNANMRRDLKKNRPLLANWVATKKIQATVVTPLPGGDLNTVTSVPQPAAAVTTSAKPAA